MQTRKSRAILHKPYEPSHLGNKIYLRISSKTDINIFQKLNKMATNNGIQRKQKSLII